MATTFPKLIFVVNPGAGKNKRNWQDEIKAAMEQRDISYEVIELPTPCQQEFIRELIMSRKPGKVVAVGGDGTIKLVAGALNKSSIPLGIIPAGSANGMAREFGIDTNLETALETVINGEAKMIHLVEVNGELCIHLSDIGFNAFVVKKFEDENTRGMWGYVKAAWKVLRQHSNMKVEIKLKNESEFIEAAMVVIANATMYGNGVVINPEGSLFDQLFEVVIIKKISLREIFKMRFTGEKFNEEKTTIYQTNWLRIHSKHKVHFQVDGEYLGKVNEINAAIIPNALYVMVPPAKK